MFEDCPLAFCWSNDSCTTGSVLNRLSSTRPIHVLVAVPTTDLCPCIEAVSLVHCISLARTSLCRSKVRPFLVSSPDGSDAFNSSERYHNLTLGTIGPSKAEARKRPAVNRYQIATIIIVRGIVVSILVFVNSRHPIHHHTNVYHCS